MDTRIIDIAERIRCLRDIMDFSVEEMAEATGMDPETYLEFESGGCDFNFTFLYKCAEKFGVDIVELLTGDAPKLDFYSIVRKNEGLDIKRHHGFVYKHMAYRFREKMVEPFVVTVPYSAEAEKAPIELAYHEGQEMDYILKGSLMFQFEDHQEIANEGDLVYYDSGRGHGLIAVGGEDCTFLAVVIKK